MKTIALLTVFLGAISLSFGQGVLIQGTSTATNVLNPVSVYGTLLIDYDFYGLPDTLNVYYEGANIFSSGLVSGTGEFSIPYGPGVSDSLTIIMDQDGITSPISNWVYVPIIVPEPASSSLLVLAGLVVVYRAGKRRKRADER